MASFTQQQQLSTEQRKLYSITRSEASELVHMYMVAQERSEDGGIEHLRAFRNELENAQGAYLGKYNNSQEGKFYKIASVLYNVIGELTRRVDENNHDDKITLMVKLFPCSKYIAEETSIYLNWAIYNWHFEYKTHHEDLDDNCFETNTCCICGFEGEDVFYFSTAYGLDNPVCDICVRCSNENEIDRDDDDDVTDADYVVDEEDEAEDIEDDEADEDYDDYEVYDDYEDEPEYDEDDEEESESEDDEEESESEDEDEDEESASEDEDDEDEKVFGCVGCNYEWRDGWIHGYKAALKKMNKTIRGIKKDIPNAPRCANCDDSHADLKRCGGCNDVQYCSVDCQSHDWKRKHKNECALYA